MQERRALGKGLSSLIPIGNRQDNASRAYLECPIEDIIPNQNQPRKLFDKQAIDELAASIEEKGILQPLIVRRLGGGKYELIAGERRLRAAKKLNLEKIPVIIKEVESEETLELALIENIQREDLNPIEEALAYKELLGKYQYTQDELAKRLGRDRSSVANTLRLLKLPEGIRAYIISGQISMGHARALLGMEDRDVQQKVADEIIKNELSVRDIENWMRRFKERRGQKDKSPESTEGESPSVAPPVSQYNSLEAQLKDILKTRVKIKSSGDKGKIIINFHSPDELDRLFQIITSKP